MKRLYICAAGILMLLISSCDRGVNPSGPGEPIRFDVAATDVQTRAATPTQGARPTNQNEVQPATRAANSVNNDPALRAVSVGVFASYTGKLDYESTTVAPDYMYNQEVRYTSSGVWEYAPVKYWPNDANDYVSFFAYAPYEDSPSKDAPTGIFNMSRSVDLGDPWINFRLPEYEHQVDLLYGQRLTQEGGVAKYDSWIDQQKHDWTEAPIRFVFRHALACIGEGVSVRMSDELFAGMQGSLDIRFNSVSIVYRNLATKARLVLRSEGSPNWKEIISGELTCSRTYTGPALSGVGFSRDATSNPAAITLDAGNGLFYIPLQIAGTPRPVADISLTYTVDTGAASFTDVATASVTFGPAEAGTVQSFALTLSRGFNLEATVVTEETGGIAVPSTLSPTDAGVTVNYN